MIELVKQVHDAGSGFVDIGGLRWTYSGGLGDPAGLSGSGNNFTLVLDDAGNTGLTSALAPVGAAVPEPSTLLVLALALAAWRFLPRRRRNP